MAEVNYTRYVAIGDSQTEGLWDGDDSVGVAGFADRLATIIDSLRPGLRYANLAIRGKRVRDVLDEQVPQALAMQPDLITVCAGMNDVIRPGRSFDRALADLDQLYRLVAESGATVATTMFPDIAELVPVGRLLETRVLKINEVIAGAAERYGFGLVDLYHADSMKDPETWSPDGIHASTKGHILFAAAAAEALGLPGSNHDWAHASYEAMQQSFRTRAFMQLRWTKNMMLPWLWRHLRGRSSGDGREPKRAQLESIGAQRGALQSDS